jgi:hypothetical protein
MVYNQKYLTLSLMIFFIMPCISSLLQQQATYRVLTSYVGCFLQALANFGIFLYEHADFEAVRAHTDQAERNIIRAVNLWDHTVALRNWRGVLITPSSQHTMHADDAC